MASAEIIHTSKRPSVEIDDISVTKFVLSRAESYGDRPALISSTDTEVVTYAELPGKINRAMNGLRAAGVKAGDIVSLHMPNTVQYPIAFHAIASIGATVTTSNPTYNAEELEHQLKLAGARFCLTIPMFKEVATAAAAAAGVEKVWVYGEEETFLSCTDDTPAEHAEFNPREQILAIPFSSGTSGLPKGVELTHASIVANLCQISKDPVHNIDMSQDDVVAGLLPFFHIFGMVVICQAALYLGGSVVVIPKFDPAKFLELVQTKRITWIPLVPPVLVFLAKHPLVEKFDLSSIRILLSGAAPLSPELTELAAKRLGVTIRQGYGMTELSPAVSVSVPGAEVAGSCGRVLPNTELKIVNPETGETLGTGVENQGEVCIRGPQVMHGYHKNPEATREMIAEDGFLHTGDIGYVTEAGDMFITDRLKELIKVKGYQVAPAELEGILLDHPAIADAAVIGIPDERAGELPKAFVVKKADATVTEAEIMSFVEEKVSAFKKLAVVEFIDAIPKSVSGKILKRVLRARAPAAGPGGAAESK